MTTLRDLIGQAAPPPDDIPTLKKLPIAYVLEKQGIEFTDQGDGHLYALCPFHNDSNPSFDVYGPELDRWGCFSCGTGGDVLDLIKALFSTQSFNETKNIAKGLIDSRAEEGWIGPTVGVKKALDIDSVRKRVDAARLSHTGAIDAFLREKHIANPGLCMDEKWLMDVFGLGESGGSVVIPYWNRAGELVTLKHRTANTKALSEPGSSFADVLYAEWLDTDPRRPVLLCEGESDTWAAMHAVGSVYAVMGLPTGVGAHPKQAELLAGREIVLAFDGDEAGRRGVERWYTALLRHGCQVRIAQLGDDMDLAKLTPDQIATTVSKARTGTISPAGLDLHPAGIERPSKGDAAPVLVSNWSFDPKRELVDTQGNRSYEGTVTPHGEYAVITSDDLFSQGKVKLWASQHGGAWYGTDREAQILLGMLQARGPFLSIGRMATVAGLHEQHFIYPGGCVGPDYWVYVPPAADVHLESRIKVRPGPWHARQVNVLRSLHAPIVMDPLLAWLAIAPLRSLLREFPVLAVTGSSGTGKTTLLETVLPAFTGSNITCNLTSTTQHSLFAFVGCTNAFPVHFDEFRPGARRETLRSLEQVIRDAYTSQVSAKGGMGDNWAEVISVAPTAPLIVSGEDAFSETSHTERMVLLGLPLAGKNPAALAEVTAWENNGLPHAYLSYLQEGLRDGWLPKIGNYSEGDITAPARQRLNLGVLDLGWTILNQFVVANGGEPLGPPNFSLILDEAAEAARHSPIYDALCWCRDEPEAMEFMKVEPHGEVFIRVENFVEFVNRRNTFTLPGGSAAVRKYLRQHFDAVGGRGTLNGKQVTGHRFPSSYLKD